MLQYTDLLLQVTEFFSAGKSNGANNELSQDTEDFLLYTFHIGIP